MDTRTDNEKLVDAYRNRVMAQASIMTAGRTPGPGDDRYEIDVEIDGLTFHAVHARVVGYDQFEVSLADPDPDPAA